MVVGLTGYLHGEGPGFIGGWLAEELQQAGHAVVAVEGDIRQHVDAVDGCDVVVHLAARVGRLLCDSNPRDVVDTNAWGTYHVARRCRAAGVRLLYVSSSEAAYAGNLYGLSKRWGEDAARLVYDGADDDLLVARLFMPYGPGHPPGYGRAALTNWVWDALKGQPLNVHRGTSRSWCWVEDTARALRLLIDRWPDELQEFDMGGGGRIWNVGRTDNVMNSLAVAALVREKLGSSSRIVSVEKPAGIADHKLPDVTPLLCLGWRPTVDLEEGIGRLAAWLQGVPVAP